MPLCFIISLICFIIFCPLTCDEILIFFFNVLQIALATSSMARASQMWQEAAEEEMSVTEAYMKRMAESKRVCSNQIVYLRR